MDFSDPVVWGSIAGVAIAAIIFVFLAFKVRALMKKDEESHRNQ